MKTHICILAGLLISSSIIYSQVDIPRLVISSGAVDASSADLRIQGTLGQTLTGGASASGQEALLGFWEQVIGLQTAIRQVPGSGDATRSLVGRLYPNPAFESSTLEITLYTTTDLRAWITSANGKTVALLLRGKLQSGQYLLEFDTNELPAGSYFVFVQSGLRLEYIKMVVK